MSSVDALAQQILSSARRELILAEEPRELRRIVHELATRSDGSDAGPSDERRIAVCREFLETMRVTTYQAWRYVCYGLTDIVPGFGRIVERTNAVAALLAGVAALPFGPFRACYRGLVSSYFSPYEPSLSASHEAAEAWDDLRTFLGANLDRLLGRAFIPPSVSALAQNRTLLDADPTTSLSQLLLDGREDKVEKVYADLGVSQTSWLRIGVARGALLNACTSDDRTFAGTVDRLLELMAMYPAVEREGLAWVLDRYSRQAEIAEHEPLRRFSVERWGNPLHKRNLVNWDAAGSGATAMVSGWLKASLIQDFFELLSADGTTDRRRVQFWRQYVPDIEDVYFALGRNAMNNRSEDFKRLRRTIGDNLSALDGTSNNNCFIMKMKGQYVVEFGETGNAAFIFGEDKLPFTLGKRLSTHGKAAWQANARMLHMDGRLPWESVFQAELRRWIGVVPATSSERARRPVVAVSRTPTARSLDGTGKAHSRRWRYDELKALCASHGVSCQQIDIYEFIVSAGIENDVLSRHLRMLGFAYDVRRNRWRWKGGP